MTVRLVAALLAASVGASCSDEDTGECCRPVTPDKQDAIPLPDDPEGSPPRDVIRRDPAFDCSQLTCVSYQGSEAFCTRKCTGETDCPEGFDCSTVLQSAYCDYEMKTETTEDDCTPSSILPTDTFCVRKSCTGASDCPDGFTCTLSSAGSGTVEDPEVRHCVKDSHMCEP